VFASLTGFMGIILAFYFAATAVEKASQTIATAITERAQIERGAPPPPVQPTSS
jgi:hypothetical protein